MSESLFFAKFDRVKQFDTEKYLIPQQSVFRSNVDNLKELILDPTQAFVTEKEKYKARSVKIYSDPLNISFEDSFMDQHKESFLKQFKKYMEHQQNILGYLKPEGLKRKLFDLQHDHHDLESITEVVNEHGSLLSQIQKDCFIIDLRREDKLTEFLEYVVTKVNEDSLKEVVFLANLIWEEYIPVQDMSFSEQEAIQFAQSFVGKHLDQLDQKFSQINYRSVQKLSQSKSYSHEGKERFSQFKKFTTFLTTTLVLVIGGYFQNPYIDSEDNYYKRELEEVGADYHNEDQFQDEDFQSEDDQVIVNKRIKH